MYSDSSSYDENFDPELIALDFDKEANLILNNLLPKKSMDKYVKSYKDFLEWKKKHGASFEENVFLVYFEELSKTLKPPTLWSIWSKLKATLSVYERIDLNNFNLLKTSLKNKCKGYKPKKSKILSLTQVNTFLQLAEDDIYLAMKVILLFGFFGALRCQELINIQTTDIEDINDQFIISINETKTYVSRNFIISRDYYKIIKKYILLRPDNMQDDRFFIAYSKGKCIRQFIGKNKISEIPSIVASFLQLSEPESYTGHCYRRSSATALSNAGGDLIKVKNHGGWKSDQVAQGYIDFSISHRKQIFDMIAGPSNNSNKNHFLNHPPVKIISIPSNGSESNNNLNIHTTDLNAPLKSKIENIMNSTVPSTSKIEHCIINSNIPSTSKIQSNSPNSNVPSTPNVLNIRNDFCELIDDENETATTNQNETAPTNKCSNEFFEGANNEDEPASTKIKYILFNNCKIDNVSINNYYCSCKHKL